MPNYQRNFVPGGTYFITIVTYHRRRFLTDESVRPMLYQALRDAQAEMPFAIPAMVIIPDHVHLLIALPPGDCAYPARLGYFKKEFTKSYLEAGGVEATTTMGIKLAGRRGVWQPRYWEHTIEDEQDFEHHFDYIHYNPVKHGYVQEVRAWPYSSFHRWVQEGHYPERWSCGPDMQEIYERIARRAGE
jgi:putative transposase